MKQAEIYMVSLGLPIAFVISFTPREDKKILMKKVELGEMKLKEIKVAEPYTEKPSEFKEIIKKCANEIFGFFGNRILA